MPLRPSKRREAKAQSQAVEIVRSIIGSGFYPDFLTSDFANQVASSIWEQARYSAGTSAADQAARYPMLATAAGAHNIQALQIIVSGVDVECYIEGGQSSDGTREKLCVDMPSILCQTMPDDPAALFSVLTAQAMAALVLCGEAFLFKHRVGGGIVGLEVVPNHNVCRERRQGKIFYDVNQSDTETLIRPGYYTSADVIQIVFTPAVGYMRGIGASEMATASVANAVLLEEFRKFWLLNNLNFAGFANLRGKTEQQIKEIGSEIADQLKGIQNAGKWALVNQDHMELSPNIQANPSNANLIEGLQRAAIDMGKLGKVPPTLANESIVGTLSYAISEAQDVQIAKNVIQPSLRAIEGGINRDYPNSVLGEAQSGRRTGQVKMRYIIDHLLKGDERSMVEMFSKAIKNSMISINAANRMMGWQTYEGEEFEYPIKPTSWDNVAAITPEGDLLAEEDGESFTKDEADALIGSLVEMGVERASLHNGNGHDAGFRQYVG